jgi:hypothetical protein
VTVSLIFDEIMRHLDEAERLNHAMLILKGLDEDGTSLEETRVKPRASRAKISRKNRKKSAV